VADLLVLSREFDLPPRWDGGPVEWGPWEPVTPMFMCPPPSDMGACDQCGSLEPQITARGVVTPLPGVERDGVHQLRVTRCPDCKHDRVVDYDTFDVFDLGPEDYTENGSWPPADAPPSTPDLTCTTCGTVGDHPTDEHPAPAPAPRRPLVVRAPRPARPGRVGRRRPDGSCTLCDDLHPDGTPCGRPAPPPIGWRPNLKGTPRD